MRLGIRGTASTTLYCQRRRKSQGHTHWWSRGLASTCANQPTSIRPHNEFTLDLKQENGTSLHSPPEIHPSGFRAGICSVKTTYYDHYSIAQSPSLACNEEQEGLVDAQLGLEGDEEGEHHMLQGANPLQQKHEVRAEHQASQRVAMEAHAEEQLEEPRNAPLPIGQRGGRRLRQRFFLVAQPQECADVHHIEPNNANDKHGDGVYEGKQIEPVNYVRRNGAKHQQ